MSEEILNFEMADVFGKELKVGDFVAYSTSCTSRGYLRRGVIYKIQPIKSYRGPVYSVYLKSITIQKNRKYHKDSNGRYDYSKFTDVQTPIIGITRRGLNKDVTNKFNIIKLGSSLEDAFTKEEIEVINSRPGIKTKF